MSTRLSISAIKPETVEITIRHATARPLRFLHCIDLGEDRQALEAHTDEEKWLRLQAEQMENNAFAQS